MPPKRNPSITNQSITDLYVDDLRRLVREEVQSTIRDELNDLTNRLGKIEADVKLLCEFKAKVDAVENAISHTSQRLDDLYYQTLPTIQKHMQDVATGLALQTLDLAVHRCTWSFTVQGLKGEKNENEEKTRDICAKLAQECLHVRDASTTDFAACHRLSRQADSGVIIRFKDLRIRNQWLAYIINQSLCTGIFPDRLK